MNQNLGWELFFAKKKVYQVIREGFVSSHYIIKVKQTLER